MQYPNRPKLIRNLLVLFSVIGLVLTGWLAGHILRYSIPAHQFRHPPVPEFDLHIKNGNLFDFEGIRRQVVLTGNPTARVSGNREAFDLRKIVLNECNGNTYFTSLPAKCHTPDGRLVQAGSAQPVTQALP